MYKWMRCACGVLVVLGMLAAATAEPPAARMREVVADPKPPERPYAKTCGDLNGDGQVDNAISGAKGPLVWYAYPDWTRHTIVAGGYDTVEGVAADIGADGDTDMAGPTTPATSRRCIFGGICCGLERDA